LLIIVTVSPALNSEGTDIEKIAGLGVGVKLPFTVVVAGTV
jgi:hypothetical protein